MQKFYKIIDFGVEMHRHRGLMNHFARAVADHRHAEHFLRFIIGENSLSDLMQTSTLKGNQVCTRIFISPISGC
jgi:oligoribonuclease (3'-5' exoribonuclease)